ALLNNPKTASVGLTPNNCPPECGDERVRIEYLPPSHNPQVRPHTQDRDMTCTGGEGIKVRLVPVWVNESLGSLN
ncbi:hypothetical protein J6590_030144, partial [Homalodisca vitripennis]